jgi:hypothetical protein
VGGFGGLGGSHTGTAAGSTNGQPGANGSPNPG